MERLAALDKVDWPFTLTADAYNLVRLPKLLAAQQGDTLCL